MDIKDILPLLMKNSDPKMAGLMSAMQGGDTSALFESMLGKDDKNKELFSMLNLMRGQKTKPPPAQGLKPIYPFVSKEILGIMVKYYK